MALVVVSTTEIFDPRPRPTSVSQPQPKKTNTLRKVTTKRVVRCRSVLERMPDGTVQQVRPKKVWVW